MSEALRRNKNSGTPANPMAAFGVFGLAFTLATTCVFPVFAKAFRGFEDRLPLLTRAWLSVSDFMVGHLPFSLVLVLLAVVAAARWAKGSKIGRRIFSDVDGQSVYMLGMGALFLAISLGVFLPLWDLAAPLNQAVLK